MAVEHGEMADLECNECGIVTKSVPGHVAESTLIEMSMALTFGTETCPECGELNTFPGFDSMLAFTCRHCGIGVKVMPEEARPVAASIAPDSANTRGKRSLRARLP